MLLSLGGNTIKLIITTFSIINGVYSTPQFCFFISIFFYGFYLGGQVGNYYYYSSYFFFFQKERNNPLGAPNVSFLINIASSPAVSYFVPLH